MKQARFRRDPARASRCARVGRACTFVVLSLLPTAAGANTNVVVWLNDWKAAREQAEREMRPVLLDFTADWCAPCRAMDARFWPDPEVRALTDRFVLVRVDFDAQTALRNKFGVASIPNVVVLDPWENPLGRLTGWSGHAGDHLALLRAVPEDFGPLAADASAAADGKADGLALERLGEVYFSTALAGASRGFFEKAVRSSALKAEPARRALVQSKIGWCGLRLGEPDAARRSFEKALKVQGGPRDLALAGLAVAWARGGDFDRADSVLEELHSAHAGSEMLPIAVEQVAKARSSNP
jgi:thiol-disulfide isomerase/thioredoxin